MKIAIQQRKDLGGAEAVCKIRAKILDLGYGGARGALYKLSPKSARVLSVADTIDGWTGAWSDALAPAGVRVPVITSTQG